jgi:hypothetical protein
MRIDRHLPDVHPGMERKTGPEAEDGAAFGP